jgi:hypothetical protein
MELAARFCFYYYRFTTRRGFVPAIEAESIQRKTGSQEQTMDYVKLGQTGPKVSRICLGCMTRLVGFS